MACQNQIKNFELSQVSVPAEIVVDILLRLSVKSLLRCRVVCKLWRSLISDPYFINSKYLASTSASSISNIKLIFSSNISHSNISICNISDALCYESLSNKVLTIDTPYKPSNPISRDHIVGSCNGLVCFYDNNGYTDFYFWNPITRIFKRASSDRFHSFTRYVCFGFGYDESTDDYKFFASSERGEAKIYSLKSGMWKTIGCFPHYESGYQPHHGNYLNGALHWATTRADYDRPSDRYTIFSFHLATETYGQVFQPDYHDENRFYMSLGALGKELCMLCYYYERRSDIWVMKVYGVKESWTKLFSVPYMSHQGILPRYDTPLFISNDGKILFEDRWKLYVYDSKTGSYYEIQNFKVYAKACTFVESLVSPISHTIP